MTVSTIKMTARQFQELGDDPVGVRLELVDGEVAVSPSPEPRHSYADRNLGFILTRHIREKNLGALFGDVNTIFGEYDVRRPDLIYFSKDRLHLVGEKAMEGPPDLCVEIISPSSTTIDRQAKFKQYQAGKVANYWIVDPHQKSIDGFQLVRGKYQPSGNGKDQDLVRLPPFADLDIPLGELWWPRRGKEKEISHR
jgi:Uma2 family endonuclease